MDRGACGRMFSSLDAVMALSAVPLGLVTSVGTFALAMAFAGMTTGLTDMLGNGRIAELEAQHDAALMNLNHACFSFAYAGPAMLMGFAREAEVAPALWFSGIAGATILVLALAGRDGALGRSVPEGAGHVGARADWAARVARGWRRAGRLLRRELDRDLGGAAYRAHAGRRRGRRRIRPAMLGLTMGIGRLLGHLVTSRGTGGAGAASAAWLSGAGLLLAAIAPGPLVAYLGFGLVGLGASVVAPLALALAGQAADPARRTLAVSRAMLLGYMGFVVGPPLLGLVSGQFRPARGLRPRGAQRPGRAAGAASPHARAAR
jgi:hypothetical protein